MKGTFGTIDCPVAIIKVFLKKIPSASKNAGPFAFIIDANIRQSDWKIYLITQVYKTQIQEKLIVSLSREIV